MPRRGVKRVVVAISVAHQHQREVIAGLALSPARRRGGWQLVLAPELATARARRDRLPWRPDGIVAWSDTPVAHRNLAAEGLPMVDLSGSGREEPVVRTDLPAICRLAIDHLLARGYRHIGIATIPAFPQDSYARGMIAEGLRRGIKVTSFPLLWPTVERDPLEQISDFAAWLTRQPRPFGLLCHAGGQALSATAACRRAGLEIPGDVGLLTSDDEPMGTLLASVPLSSVGKPNRLVGERLAERLEKLMSGQDPGPPEILAPTGIIARESTDLALGGDPAVVAALQWIAGHLAEPIGVEAVARAVGMSRRALERHFQDVRRTTIHAEIQRLRVVHAQHLVAAGETVASAASKVGLSSSALYKRFQLQFGSSPRTWAEGILLQER